MRKRLDEIFFDMVTVFQPNPPTYDVTKVKTPIVLFSAADDWLAVPKVGILFLSCNRTRGFN